MGPQLSGASRAALSLIRHTLIKKKKKILKIILQKIIKRKKKYKFFRFNKKYKNIIKLL